ncbi:DedA family protein [Lyngbya confervoides]|uniref:DedA family protein n=1 Tax=Lyngbya confervoides BDU141951 TaxID=1574623 RepID=A0ABD4T3D9_9CYAN|nr:DedA family protein [Lyngbya confervoides]MCM1983184.1 DedA family protein [Lyngbya confervoides BDU141951]
MLETLAKQYGYGAVFLGILLENLGLPLPGEAIVLVGGFMAGRGDLNLEGVILSASSGAIIGNTIGYGLGIYGGWPLLLKIVRFFKVEETRLEELKDRFRNNASQAVFFGRFVTLLRIFAGPMAGIVEMPFGKFMFYNVVGAALWSATMVSLAFFAGEIVPLEQLLRWVGQFGVLILGGVGAWFAAPPLLRSLAKLRKKATSET